MTEPRSSRSPRSNTSNTDQGSPAPVDYALIHDEKLTDKAISGLYRPISDSEKAKYGHFVSKL